MSPDPSRFAAIDIGTVTCRLLVADVTEAGLDELERRVTITNLGLGVDKTGVLRADSIARVSETIASYREAIDALQPADGPEIPVVALATSASRDAKNADELIAELRRSRVELAVIPGTREAALSFKGASQAFGGEKIMVVDVGGGSTEIIFGLGGGEPVFRHSFDVGCRRVTERFLHSEPPTPTELDEANAWIRQVMAPVFAEAFEQGCELDFVVAVAGTATSMVSIDQRMEVYDSAKVNGSVVTGDVLRRISGELAAMSLEERQQVVGLEPQRAPVIVAGTLILGAILELAGVDGFTVSESDILQGIILDAAGR